MVVLAPHGEVAKIVVRLATHKLFVSVDAVVVVEILATTLAGKNMATVLPNFVLARHSGVLIFLLKPICAGVDKRLI